MQRKLTAILSADVVGYSGLMEADETGTLERLKANRAAIFDPHVAIHGGRVFKLLGDGALVEFSSVVAAVNCALAIQAATEKAGAENAKPIRYRIGVNLGDIIIDGDDIYGDGVNVAARLQTLAPVGGIALSKTVRDNVKGKLPCEFDDMGEHTVKNIETPVHVFSVRAASRTEPEGHKVEEPRKLSICVLPFANMSGDVEQEYFSDGISEDIITDLSKVSALSVVARNTSFQFKGKSVDIKNIARQLGVSHILEGSVRKAGGRVRITAQLIDGSAGDHVWAERYDRDLNDIFALQDEISEAIVKAMKLKLLPEEKKAIEKRGTESLDAYNLYLMARKLQQNGAHMVRGGDSILRLCSSAIKIDANYADAWALLAMAQSMRSTFYGGTNRDGLEAADRALQINPLLSSAHCAKSRVLMNVPDLAGAWSEIEIALRLDPESSENNMFAGLLSNSQGRYDDAIRYWSKGVAAPDATFWSFRLLMTAFLCAGDRTAARAVAERVVGPSQKLLSQEPDNGLAMGSLAEAYAVLDEPEQAREMISRAMLLAPDNTVMMTCLVRALVLLQDFDAALDMFEHASRIVTKQFVGAFTRSPDLAPLRELPRFNAILAAAKARWAVEEAATAKSPPA